MNRDLSKECCISLKSNYSASVEDLADYSLSRGVTATDSSLHPVQDNEAEALYCFGHSAGYALGTFFSWENEGHQSGSRMSWVSFLQNLSYILFLIYFYSCFIL